MTIVKIALRLLFIPVLFCAATVIADTAVIIHPSNASALDKDTVKKIFLGKTKSFPSGGTAVPINQKDGDATRAGFDQNVLGKSSSQIKAYWSKLVFTGKGTPPKEVENDAEIKALVANNPNIIGYIDATQVDDSVKVVFSF
ncbi:phosphate ABC transporter substrate-binding protein [Teredinibacter franksiae]|uniref:phosphate ABC transporter substrate-binding protein n=1 Tax=Teredinibacter franksiae TaxID=2761453 RepID=UPI0016278602|nr:phosphate ABC transporter substrate-binding protein [Teredinibacter franksiae]